MAWLISCVILTVWNLSRGLNLWAGYNFGGAMMALLALMILWKEGISQQCSISSVAPSALQTADLGQCALMACNPVNGCAQTA